MNNMQHQEDTRHNGQKYQRDKFADISIEGAHAYHEMRFSPKRKAQHVDIKEKSIIRRVFKNIGYQRRVLDVPCGAGRYFDLLKSQSECLIELDLAPAMVKYTKNRYADQQKGDVCGHPRFYVGDAESLPYRSKSIDLVFCMRLFHHLDSSMLRVNIMREFARVTKQWVILSFYHYYCYRHLKKVIRRKPDRGQYLPFKVFEDEARLAGLSVVKPYAVSLYVEPQWIVLLTQDNRNLT